MNLKSQKIYSLDRESEKRRKVQITGFASPAADESADRINLNKELIQNSNTYVYQTAGDSMIDIGILPGAMIVFEQRLKYYPGDVVVVRINDEIYVRELSVEKSRRYLCPANEQNKNYQPQEVTEFLDFEIFGAVTNSINTHKRK